MKGRRALALALALAAAMPAACGRKGSPVAPELRVPVPVADLGATVRETSIDLAWVNPTRRADHTLLRDLTLARVYRVEDDGRGEPKPALLSNGVIAGYTELATISLAAPAPAVLNGNRVGLADSRGLVLGRRYTYVVVTADSTGRVSPPSRRVSITYIAAPEAPTGLIARPGDREVRLLWQPPEHLIGGSDVPGPLAYEVLRAMGPDAPLAPVGRTASGELAFADHELENDRTYYYAVRALRPESDATAYGPLSARVAGTPRKTTAPSQPTGLVAIPSEGTVRLSWKPSPEDDVSGYIVYRAPLGGAFVRIGSTRAPATTFTDRDVPRGTWRYAVAAEDSAAIRNESTRSGEAKVTVP